MKKICFENGLPRFETISLVFPSGNSCCLGDIKFLEPTFEGDALINLKLAYIDNRKANQYIEKSWNELVIPDYINEISLNFYYDGTPISGIKEINYTLNWKRKCQRGTQDYEFFSEKVLISISSNCNNISNQTPEIISLILEDKPNQCSDISIYFKEILNADKYALKYCDENDICDVSSPISAKDENGNSITKITLDCNLIQQCVTYEIWIQAIDLNGNLISESQVSKKYKTEAISCNCERPDFNLIPSLIPNTGNELLYYSNVDSYLLEINLNNLKSGNADFLSYKLKWREKDNQDWQESFFSDFQEIYLKHENQEYEIQLCGSCLSDTNCFNQEKINNLIQDCKVKSKISLEWNNNAPFSITYMVGCSGNSLQNKINISLPSTGNNTNELVNLWIANFSNSGDGRLAYITPGDSYNTITMEFSCSELGCSCNNALQKFWLSSSNFAATMVDMGSECLYLDNSSNLLNESVLNPKPFGCDDEIIEWTFKMNKIDDDFFGQTPKNNQSPFSIKFEYDRTSELAFNWNLNESRSTNDVAGYRKNCTIKYNQSSDNCAACLASDLFTNFKDWFYNFIDTIKCFYLSQNIQTKNIDILENDNDFRVTINFIKKANMPFNCNTKFQIYYFLRDGNYSNFEIHQSSVINNKFTYSGIKGNLEEVTLPSVSSIRNLFCRVCPQKPCVDGLPDCNKEICGDIQTITTPEKPKTETPLPEQKSCCPIQVGDLKVLNKTQTEIELGWNKVDGAQNYTIRYRIVGINNEWKEYLLTPNTTSYKFINLFPDVEYEFQIKTRCSQINTSDTSLNVYKDYDWSETLKVKTLDYEVPESPQCYCPNVEFGELINGFNYNSISFKITNNPLNIYNRVYFEPQYLQLDDSGNPLNIDEKGNPLWIQGVSQFSLGKGENITKKLEKLALAGTYKFRIITKCERFTETFIISDCENSNKIDIPIPDCLLTINDNDINVQTELDGTSYKLKEITLLNYSAIGSSNIIIKIKDASQKFELTNAPFIIKNTSLNNVLFTKGESWSIQFIGECSQNVKTDTIIKNGNSPEFPPSYIDVDINCVANGSKLIDSSNPHIGNNATLFLQLDSDKLKQEEQSYTIYAEIKGYDPNGNLVITKTNLNVQKNS